MSPKDLSEVYEKLGPNALKRLLEAAASEQKAEREEKPEPGESPGSADTPPTGEEVKEELPEFYYSVFTKEYFLRGENDDWIPINENSVKRHLKAAGYLHPQSKGGYATPMEQCLNQIQIKNCVSYAAPLSGHDAGFYQINGKKILVTSSPKFIEPVPGEFPVLAQLMENMFVTDAKDQRPYVYGWLKVHVEALRARKWRQHQAFAMCGPVDCGKSLFQNLMTVLFGGRAAKPYQYMIGETTFNEDLFEAEHLMIEDDAESTHHALRKTFGAHIKAFAVNRDHRCHGKNKKGLVLHPRWAVTISVNDEPQRLLVLPPIDQDTEDKIMLLKINMKPMPMPTVTDDEKDAFWKTLVAELPAFVAFLLKWEIPELLRSSRFGIIHYHHPDILGAVDEVSQEFRLLNMIDEEITFHRGEPWTGTALELERLLTGELSHVNYEARKLFYFTNACGTYLASLARKAPDRVVKLPRKGNTRDWQIIATPGKIHNGMIHTNGVPLGTN
jgi:hypothetical protein